MVWVWVWLRTAVFAGAFVATFFVWLPQRILRFGGDPTMVSGVPWVAGIFVIAAGVALMVWCWGSFGRDGRGTPAPFDPPRKLVIRGPYRYVRNPMYIGGILVLVGEAILFASIPLLLYAASFWLACHLMVVAYEERALTRSFAPDYGEY